MKSQTRYLFLLLSLLVANCPVFSQKTFTGQTIEQILALPDDEIDLGIACLVLANDAYPDMNLEFFDYALDYMANRINVLMQGNTGPEARIGMLNTYLYRAGWWNDSITFTYDLDDLEANKKENQFLNGYLATKKGSCVTMAMLHLVLADRLGWPISPVRTAKHFFARYIAENFTENNIEATSGGGYVPNQQYISDADIPANAIENGVYMRTLTKKEYIASLLLNNFRHFFEREDNLEKAMYYLHLAVSVDSTLSPAYWNLGMAYKEYARKLNNRMLSEMIAAHEIYKIGLSAMRRAWTTGSASKMGVKIPQPPKPSLRPPKSVGPSLAPNGSLTLAQKTALTQQEKLLFIGKQNELQMKLNLIKARYIPQIKEAFLRSQWSKERAEELGIVLKFPEEFFLKQAESIEKFKKSGKY